MGLRPQERHEAILAPGLPYHIAARDVRATSERYLMMLRSALLTLACTAGLAGVAHAQQTQPQNADSVPKAYRPPPGMCRIWLTKCQRSSNPHPRTAARPSTTSRPTARLSSVMITWRAARRAKTRISPSSRSSARTRGSPDAGQPVRVAAALERREGKGRARISLRPSACAK